MPLPCIRHTINPRGLFPSPSWLRRFIGDRIPIRPFGLLVGTGVMTGYSVGRHRARAIGLDPDICGNMMVWTIVVGFVFAHLFSVFFYFPTDLLLNPWILLEFWDRLSSFGGFVGAVVGGYWYSRREGVSYLKYSDAMIYGGVVGWTFGRMGCTTVHDHPGLPSEFFLAVACGARGAGEHDLGLYELLFTLGMLVVLFVLRKVRPFHGFHPALTMFLYAPVRFAFDSLRVEDTTYLGATPGQYFSAAMLIGSIALTMYGLRVKKQGVFPGSEPPVDLKPKPASPAPRRRTKKKPSRRKRRR